MVFSGFKRSGQRQRIRVHGRSICLLPSWSWTGWKWQCWIPFQDRLDTKELEVKILDGANIVCYVEPKIIPYESPTHVPPAALPPYGPPFIFGLE